MSTKPLDATLVARLQNLLGPHGVIDEAAQMAAYLVDWRRLYAGDAPLVLRPATTLELAASVELLAAHGVAIVPQGGNTGMVGGGVPRAGRGEVVISLARMNRIRHVDSENFTMEVEAGCVLADVQRAAEEADRFFPLSLGAEGSCQIGGNLATNAGGTAVLRYGNARDLVLGLEVVLPDGRVWGGLRALRKDNTGYDLKQLFLGAEGTLGVITAAVLKLFPRPAQSVTTMVAVNDPAAAGRLLTLLRAGSGDGVTTFEYIHRACLDLVFEHIPGTADPFAARHDHYVLVELTSPRADADLDGALEAALGSALESGDVVDAVVARSDAQAKTLWRLRESISEADNATGACIRHDVSVAVSRVPDFLEAAAPRVLRVAPGCRVTPFGHLGDGNIHYNVVPAPDGDARAFLALADEMATSVHELVMEMGGSFSAEHGVGQAKRADLARYRSDVELDLMRAVKAAIDPAGIMNPGKVV